MTFIEFSTKQNSPLVTYDKTLVYENLLLQKMKPHYQATFAGRNFVSASFIIVTTVEFCFSKLSCQWLKFHLFLVRLCYERNLDGLGFTVYSAWYL